MLLDINSQFRQKIHNIQDNQLILVCNDPHMWNNEI